jgi:methylenetetrahydrofolate dehydrogenase (NADP+)/methenyltetrahydrofolate cyclohydrolase
VSIAKLIDGRAIGQKVRDEVRARAVGLAGRSVRPSLAVVLVGDDPASHVYVRNKTKACHEVGIAVRDHRLPATTTQAELMGLVAELNGDTEVDGILVQMPLPPGLDSRPVLEAIAPAKDVDGFHPVNVGRLWGGAPGLRPCTPSGVMRLLEEEGIAVAGKEAVVLGRSHLVGKPMAALLLEANATVAVGHSRTAQLPELVGRAEILVAAIGRPELVQGSWLRPGAIVIDVGMNRLPDGRLVGDVDFASAVTRASAITPVPGGVGPMTIALLLSNTVWAAEQRRGR